MREMGIRGLLVYCSDYRCSHSGKISADRWSDDVRLSDLEPLFSCQACGIKGAELRPDLLGQGPARQRPATAEHGETCNAIPEQHARGALKSRAKKRPQLGGEL